MELCYLETMMLSQILILIAKYTMDRFALDEKGYIERVGAILELEYL